MNMSLKWINVKTLVQKEWYFFYSLHHQLRIKVRCKKKCCLQKVMSTGNCPCAWCVNDEMYMTIRFFFVYIFKTSLCVYSYRKILCMECAESDISQGYKFVVCDSYWTLISLELTKFPVVFSVFNTYFQTKKKYQKQRFVKRQKMK
jgi:hypothetical protein